MSVEKDKKGLVTTLTFDPLSYVDRRERDPGFFASL
jgi:hypothetical protein